MAKGRPQVLPRVPDRNLLQVWYLAAAEEFGLEIQSTPEAQMQLSLDLYRVRKAVMDPNLDTLRMVRMSNGYLWILPREETMENTEEADAS